MQTPQEILRDALERIQKEHGALVQGVEVDWLDVSSHEGHRVIVEQVRVDLVWRAER